MRTTAFYLLFAALFLCSRILFLNTGPAFFDSAEYITRLSSPNFKYAIISGHVPLHAGYIVFFWPIYHLAQLFHLPPMYIVQIAQVVVALLGFLAFYGVIKRVFGQNLAKFSLLIAMTLPIIWITQESVMMETFYVSCFFIGWYFFTVKSKLGYVFGSLFLGLSFLTHLAPLFYIPPLLFSIFIFQKDKIKKISIAIFISFVLSQLVLGLFINPHNLLLGTVTALLGKTQEHMDFSLSLASILVLLRNAIIPTVYNHSLFAILAASIGLILAFKKDKTLFTFLLLLLIPIIFVNQWWDSLLFGRHALISSFGIALAISFLFLFLPRYLRLLVFIALFTSSWFTVLRLSYPAPYELLAQNVTYLPVDSLYIESHFARPQVSLVREKDVFYVDEPSFNNSILPSVIDSYLKNNKRVFISSQALSEPYGHFEGPYLHPLSLSYRNSYRLSLLLGAYSFKEIMPVSYEDNIIIYEMSSLPPHLYPAVPNLRLNSRNIDEYDPFSALFWRYAPL